MPTLSILVLDPGDGACSSFFSPPPGPDLDLIIHVRRVRKAVREHLKLIIS